MKHCSFSSLYHERFDLGLLLDTEAWVQRLVIMPRAVDLSLLFLVFSFGIR